MKKSLKKRLSLHRETLYALQEGRLGQVVGGIVTFNTCGNPCTKGCSTPCTDTCHTLCGGVGCPQ
jgi:hypothetical protein